MIIGEILGNYAINITSNGIYDIIKSKLGLSQRMKIPKNIAKDELIRFSIAYLFRIKLNNKYLLVKGKRIDQFQPIGGVYKIFPYARKLFNELEILDDNKIPIDETNKDDLRIRVPRKNIKKFLRWFDSKKDREVDQQREFIEELVKTNVLSQQNFPYIQSSELYTAYNFRFSDYYQCYEVLIYQIFEPIFNSDQKKEIEKLFQEGDTDYYIWTEEDLIRSLGRDKNHNKEFAIGEHANFLISKNHKLK